MNLLGGIGCKQSIYMEMGVPRTALFLECYYNLPNNIEYRLHMARVIFKVQAAKPKTQFTCLIGVLGQGTRHCV